MSKYRLEMVDDKESEYGVIMSVSGPIVVADQMRGSKIFELVHVGHNKLMGEIIGLDKEKATIQVFEETTGLTVGDPVLRTGSPLSVHLGPGILDCFFDGIQRPLVTIADDSQSVFIPSGLHVDPLDLQKEWFFRPTKQAGEIVAKGDVFGIVKENDLISEHKICLPPSETGGTVSFIVEAGYYTLEDVLLEVEIPGKSKLKKYYLSHTWPVRQSRPVIEQLKSTTPLITGLRVLDSLFPSTLGGKVALPGNCGKTVICHSITKYSNSDISVHVCCGGRGNELAQVMLDLPMVFLWF